MSSSLLSFTTYGHLTDKHTHDFFPAGSLEKLSKQSETIILTASNNLLLRRAYILPSGIAQ